MSDEKFFHPKSERLTDGSGRPGRDYTTIVAGPYPHRTRVQVHGYHTGGGGGDDSTAWLDLIVDGAPVARAEDKHFNTYNLHIWRDIYLSAGAQLTVSVKGGNTKSDTWTLGVEGWVTYLWP